MNFFSAVPFPFNWALVIVLAIAGLLGLRKVFSDVPRHAAEFAWSGSPSCIGKLLKKWLVATIVVFAYLFLMFAPFSAAGEQAPDAAVSMSTGSFLATLAVSFLVSAALLGLSVLRVLFARRPYGEFYTPAAYWSTVSAMMGISQTQVLEFGDSEPIWQDLARQLMHRTGTGADLHAVAEFYVAYRVLDIENAVEKRMHLSFPPKRNGRRVFPSSSLAWGYWNSTLSKDYRELNFREGIYVVLFPNSFQMSYAKRLWMSISPGKSWTEAVDEMERVFEDVRDSEDGRIMYEDDRTTAIGSAAAFWLRIAESTSEKNFPCSLVFAGKPEKLAAVLEASGQSAAWNAFSHGVPAEDIFACEEDILEDIDELLPTDEEYLGNYWT